MSGRSRSNSHRYTDRSRSRSREHSHRYDDYRQSDDYSRRDDYKRRDDYERRDDYKRRDDYERRDDYKRRDENSRRSDHGRSYRPSGSVVNKYENISTKQLQPVNYDITTLPPFEKNFYVESPITANRDVEEVSRYLQENEIQVNGCESIKALLTFEECNFPQSILNVIKEQNYIKPTPIQAIGWPIVLQGKDVVGIAETGSGKTISFLIPAIIHILDTPLAQYREGPRVLILAPTRELVCQIADEAIKFTKGTSIKTVRCFGGVPQSSQMKDFQSGCDICVATPGRLIDFIKRGVTSLSRCTFLILDEADRMLEMGFEVQVQDIIGQIRPDRQTVMWTATWPQAIQQFALGFMFHPLQINIGNPDLHANESVKQIIEVCQERDRDSKMNEIVKRIGSEKKVLIFVKTKRSADNLCYKLRDQRYRVACMHGDKVQAERDRALSDFKSGAVNYLIATDVASRGLDIRNIEIVINYEMPSDIENYIHRIGRTGRMGRSVEGEAISLFTYADARLAKDLISVLKGAHQEVPSELLNMRY
ncbi:hypothetical protein ENUP19_0305G0077 [Entamoeba nuttalli]|uniref:RNA helicase n=1 Tax=Entamoeba nuttalli TaxID=412467 RepID=A0ABQ0DVE4_9EUKA